VPVRWWRSPVIATPLAGVQLACWGLLVIGLPLVVLLKRTAAPGEGEPLAA
jgi:hypothetical protein